MKVQLIFAPPKERTKLSDIVEKVYPPLGVLYIAAYLREKMPHLKLRVTDGLLIGWEAMVGEVKTFAPDVIFFSYITPCAMGAYAAADHIKGASPGTVTVFGGPHATALPLEAFERSRADFVIVGEGEETALELVRALERGRKDLRDIDGLVWRDEGKIIRNNPRQFMRDIDTIPFPARDLVDMRSYKGWFVHRKTPETSILFSRGCPFDCTFCTNAVWKSSKPWLRLRSPKRIVDEMESLKASGIREVFDNSDEFNCNLQFAMAVCDEIKDRKINMPWKTQLRASPFSEDLVRKMAESGCWYVHLGIESGNERTLKGIRKKITLDETRRACGILKKYGIKVFGLFMLFNAWEEDGHLVFENVSQTERTLEFAKEMIDKKLLDYMSCTITTPYPGSELFGISRKFGLIKDDLLRDWSRWLTDESFIMRLPGITEREESHLYFRGSLLRAYCYLKSGNWSLKDVPVFLGKFIKSVFLRVKGLFGK
ncbi:MAG: radical SAM protein [Candidatus Omnitrophota bacterium]